MDGIRWLAAGASGWALQCGRRGSASFEKRTIELTPDDAEPQAYLSERGGYAGKTATSPKGDRCRNNVYGASRVKL